MTCWAFYYWFEGATKIHNNRYAPDIALYRIAIKCNKAQHIRDYAKWLLKQVVEGVHKNKLHSKC